MLPTRIQTAPDPAMLTNRREYGNRIGGYSCQSASHGDRIIAERSEPSPRVPVGSDWTFLILRDRLMATETLITDLQSQPIGHAGANTRALRVAVIGHIRFAVAEPFQGGMEAHCASLCRGLAHAGHDVALFAAGGSHAVDRHVAICGRPYEDVLPWAEWRGTPQLEDYQREAFERAWQQVLHGGFDVVHNNTLFPDLIDWAARDGVPMVTSQHVPPFGRMRDAVVRAAGDPLRPVTVTSSSQMPLWFDRPVSNMHVVHNGIDTGQWQPAADRSADGAYFWSGRITPNKGTALALQAAHRADVAIDLAGTIEDEIYFAREVEPLVDERRRYVGHLSGERLRRTVALARALVVTPAWDEPFGLVAAEALACDVPVIAFDRGALREVVGPCGAIIAASDVDGLAAALRAPPRLAAGMARARAERKFSLPAMIAGYETLYRSAMAAARGLKAVA